MTATAENAASGQIISMQLNPWLMFGVPTVCFLLAARVWRIVTGRTS